MTAVREEGLNGGEVGELLDRMTGMAESMEQVILNEHGNDYQHHEDEVDDDGPAGDSGSGARSRRRHLVTC